MLKKENIEVEQYKINNKSKRTNFLNGIKCDVSSKSSDDFHNKGYSEELLNTNSSNNNFDNYLSI